MKNMPVLEPTCVSLKLHNCLWKINLSLNWYVYPWGDVCPLRAAGEEISSNEWLYVSCTLSCSSVCVVIRLRPGLRRDGVLITERCKRFLLFWGTHSFLSNTLREPLHQGLGGQRITLTSRLYLWPAKRMSAATYQLSKVKGPPCTSTEALYRPYGP